ncbi:MAG: hypothetical protein AB7O24_15940 [Kofleriaceae bacterium]
MVGAPAIAQETARGGELHAREATEEVSYREAIIEVDERVIVFAGGTREPDPDRASTGGYRDAGPTRFRFTGTERNPIVISDEPELFRNPV